MAVGFFSEPQEETSLVTPLQGLSAEEWNEYGQLAQEFLPNYYIGGQQLTNPYWFHQPEGGDPQYHTAQSMQALDDPMQGFNYQGQDMGQTMQDYINAEGFEALSPGLTLAMSNVFNAFSGAFAPLGAGGTGAQGGWNQPTYAAPTISQAGAYQEYTPPDTWGGFGETGAPQMWGGTQSEIQTLKDAFGELSWDGELGWKGGSLWQAGTDAAWGATVKDVAKDLGYQINANQADDVAVQLQDFSQFSGNSIGNLVEGFKDKWEDNIKSYYGDVNAINWQGGASGEAPWKHQLEDINQAGPFGMPGASSEDAGWANTGGSVDTPLKKYLNKYAGWRGVTDGTTHTDPVYSPYSEETFALLDAPYIGSRVKDYIRDRKVVKENWFGEDGPTMDYNTMDEIIDRSYEDILTAAAQGHWQDDNVNPTSIQDDTVLGDFVRDTKILEESANLGELHSYQLGPGANVDISGPQKDLVETFFGLTGTEINPQAGGQAGAYSPRAIQGITVPGGREGEDLVTTHYTQTAPARAATIQSAVYESELAQDLYQDALTGQESNVFGSQNPGEYNALTSQSNWGQSSSLFDTEGNLQYSGQDFAPDGEAYDLITQQYGEEFTGGAWGDFAEQAEAYQQSADTSLKTIANELSQGMRNINASAESQYKSIAEKEAASQGLMTGSAERARTKVQSDLTSEIGGVFENSGLSAEAVNEQMGQQIENVASSFATALTQNYGAAGGESSAEASYQSALTNLFGTISDPVTGQIRAATKEDVFKTNEDGELVMGENGSPIWDAANTASNEQGTFNSIMQGFEATKRGAFGKLLPGEDMDWSKAQSYNDLTGEWEEKDLSAEAMGPGGVTFEDILTREASGQLEGGQYWGSKIDWQKAYNQAFGQEGLVANTYTGGVFDDMQEAYDSSLAGVLGQYTGIQDVVEEQFEGTFGEGGAETLAWQPYMEEAKYDPQFGEQQVLAEYEARFGSAPGSQAREMVEGLYGIDEFPDISVSLPGGGQGGLQDIIERYWSQEIDPLGTELGLYPDPDAAGCFHPKSKIELEDGSVKDLRDVKVGDMVKVSDNGKIKYSKVMAQKLKSEDKKFDYINIKTENASLRMTPMHRIFIGNLKKNKMAKDLKVGDKINIVHDNKIKTEIVKSIDVTIDKGAYDLFTYEGTIAVDNVICSCYSLFPHKLMHFAVKSLYYITGKNIDWLVNGTNGVTWDGHIFKRIGKYLSNKWRVSHGVR